MDESTRKILEEPFPSEQVKPRRGSFGKVLAYAEVHAFIAKLNLAFAGDWSFDIAEHSIYDEEVVVLGRLTAGNVTKSAFGGSSITRAKDSGEKVSITDDLKAAASDSLKKCSSLLGLGLCLYGAQTVATDSPTKAPGRSVDARKGSSEGPGQGRTHSDGSGITERQLAAILTLAESKGGGQVGVRTKILDGFGVPIEKLDRRQASEVISALNNGGLGQKAGMGGAA